MEGTVYGIDLGTTYSCIAYIDDEQRASVVPNKDSTSTTPSVVLFEPDSTVVVGRQAKREAEASPDETCQLVKRRMGEEDWTFDAYDKKWTASLVSSFILKALASDVQRVTGQEVKRVVITVPAYFGHIERTATERAGMEAGFTVEGIINEPMAAALSYGFAEAGTGKDETVLVYDLGGGTFDTTVIKIAAGNITTIATDGDHFLGGANWDEALAKHVAKEFCNQAPDAEDPLTDPYGRQGLMNLVEEEKQALSERPSVLFIVSHDGARAKVPVSVEQFEALTADLLDETITITKRVMAAAAEKGVTKYGRILLVGGSSKMPAVKKRLEQEFGVPAELRDPDLAVVKGAATYARKIELEDKVWEQLSKEGQVPYGSERDLSKVPKDVLDKTLEKVAQDAGVSIDQAKTNVTTVLTNVCSKAFGTGVMMPQFDGQLVKKVVFLCHQNDTLPLKTEATFYSTHDNQLSVHVEVFEQGGAAESDLPADNKVIIEGRIENIPPGHPKGTPIHFVMKMGKDGTLELSARHASKDEPLTLTIKTGVTAPEAIADGVAMAAGTTLRE